MIPRTVWRWWHVRSRTTRRRIALAVLAVALATAAVVVASAVVGAVVLVRSLDGRDRLADGVRALRDQRAADARVLFGRAHASFRGARTLVDLPLFAPARRVPLLSRQLYAASAIATAGELASRAGAEATGAIEVAPEGWAVRNGAVDLDAVRTAAAAARAALPHARRAVDVLEASPRTWLVPPLRSARDQARALMRPATEGLRIASEGLDRLPSMLGAERPKRYVIAFVNPSELRGTGGFFGYFTILEARDGRMRLVEGGRPTEEFAPLFADGDVPSWFRDAYGRYGATRMWQQVNMSPDFPTVARAIARKASPDGRPADGVIQIDPAGVSALLDLAGDIRIGREGRVVNARNVQRVLGYSIYRSVPDRRNRGRVTGQLIDAAFDKALSRRVEVGSRTLDVLGGAAARGHLQVYATDPLDEGALARIGLSGEVARVGGASDVLGVYSANGVGNKIDWFLRREIDYRAVLDPRTGAVTGEVKASFRNLAPTEKEPRVMIASRAPDIPGSGTNRQIVVFARPGGDQLVSATRDERPIGLLPAREASLAGFHSHIDVPSRRVGTLTAAFRTPGGLRGSGDTRTYRLHVLHQPTTVPDVVRVSLQTPPGWAVTGRTTYSGALDRDLVLDVTLRRERPGGVVEALFRGPARLAKRILRSIF